MGMMRWVRGLASLVRRRALDDELDEEIRTHLELATEEYVAAGMTPEDAARAARRDFGGVDQVRERHLDARGFRWVEALARDVRFGVRSLLRRPSFTLVAVASLAIGIGANTTVFSLVNAILLRGLSVERPEELVDVFETGEAAFASVPLSYPNYEDLRDGTRDVFSGLGASWWVPVQVGGQDGGEIASGFAEVVTGDYFPTIGVEATIGRTILPDDDVSLGGHPVVMLGYDFWRQSLGGDPDVLGSDVRVNGLAYTVVGVAPSDYPGSMTGMKAQLFAPMSMADVLFGGGDMRASRRSKGIYVRGRLSDGVTLEQAEAAVDRVRGSLEASAPDGWTPGGGFALFPTSAVVLFPDFDPFVKAIAWVLLGAVGLVLLLACTNLASFLLARALDRRREIAMRLAIGASRGDLVRQLVVESLLLGAVAGTAGLGLALVLTGAIERYEIPMTLPIGLDLGLDGRVLAFAAGISLLAGLALGLLPALQSTRPDLSSTLRGERSAGGSRRQLRWRNVLVVAQLTISLVLLFGAGLAFRSLQAARRADPGFGHDPTALVSVITPSTRFSLDEANRYTDRLRDRFLRVPGVEAVGRADMLPLGTNWNNLELTIDGHEPPAGQDWFEIARLEVDESFLDAVGIPLLEGRNFDERDRTEGERVAIVSEAMARRFWPDGSAIGQMIREAGDEEADPGSPNAGVRDIRIVGVAADIKVRTLGEEPRPLVYVPLGRSDNLAVAFLARTSGDADRTRLAMVAAGLEEDPDLWVFTNRTLEEYLSVQTLPWRLTSGMLAVFGLLALTLAAIGLYGIVSYAVTSRTSEVGVRVAMGADRNGIVRLLLGSGTRLLAAGSVAGLVLSLGLGRLVEGLLFGVSGLDVSVLAGSWLLLMAIGWLAAWIPARRASRLDPVTALRGE